jgi:Membrane protease subunits, stomatin/prohibitin homologs
VGHPRAPRRAEVGRPAAVDQGHDGEADAGRSREARRDPAGRGIKQAAILAAEGEKQSAILKAEGQKQAAILSAEGQSQAIETVFKAIHEGNPDPQLLAYQYLQVLPQIAQGDANKVWVIPSELTRALGGISDRILPPGDDKGR